MISSIAIAAQVEVGEVAVAVVTGGPLKEPALPVLIGDADDAAGAAARGTGAIVVGGDELLCLDDELESAVAAVAEVGELDSVEEGEVLDDPVVDVRELASVGDGGVIDNDLGVEMVCIDGGMLLGAIDDADDPTVAAIDEEGDGGTAIDLERISSSAGGSVPAVGNCSAEMLVLSADGTPFCWRWLGRETVEWNPLATSPKTGLGAARVFREAGGVTEIEGVGELPTEELLREPNIYGVFPLDGIRIVSSPTNNMSL